MISKIITLAPADDVTGARDRIEWAQADCVVLVLPHGVNTYTWHEVDFALLGAPARNAAAKSPSCPQTGISAGLLTTLGSLHFGLSIRQSNSAGFPTRTLIPFSAGDIAPPFQTELVAAVLPTTQLAADRAADRRCTGDDSDRRRVSAGFGADGEDHPDGIQPGHFYYCAGNARYPDRQARLDRTHCTGTARRRCG